MARNILDGRVKEIIEKWQRVAQSERREERVAILKQIFVESDELLTLDERRQDQCSLRSLPHLKKSVRSIENILQEKQ